MGIKKGRLWKRVFKLAEKTLNAYNSNKEGTYLRYLNRYLKFNKKYLDYFKGEN